MKIIYFISLTVFMSVFCIVFLLINADTYTVDITLERPDTSLDDYITDIEQDREIIKISDRYIENNRLYITLESVSEGRAFLNISLKNSDTSYLSAFYVHKGGIITYSEFFGDCTGGGVVKVCICIYLIIIIASLVYLHTKKIRQNLYNYNNAERLGVIIFLAFVLADQLFGLYSMFDTGRNGMINDIEDIFNSTLRFAVYVLPGAFVLSVMVTISNIHLLIREGRSFKNILGIILGTLICIATVSPLILDELLQSSEIVDIHNMNGMAMYVKNAFIASIYTIVTYLECVLAGTVIVSLKAARNIPAFDMDYILILGCQIQSDGTLTKLLQGRADRAVWFAEKQKEAGGKDVIFVPTGGQGADEVISEGQAIENYLIGIGISKDRILSEQKSVNTIENMSRSMELIRDNFDGRDPKIAFSTTNYHVFRSGVIAYKLGIKMDGIGSKTRRYFWINAFIREFIAELYYGRKKHLLFIALFCINIILLTHLFYISNNM